MWIHRLCDAVWTAVLIRSKWCSATCDSLNNRVSEYILECEMYASGTLRTETGKSIVTWQIWKIWTFVRGFHSPWRVTCLKFWFWFAEKLLWFIKIPKKEGISRIATFKIIQFQPINECIPPKSRDVINLPSKANCFMPTPGLNLESRI